MLNDNVAQAARGPVRRTERALAPDLARGSMLMLIALANASGVVFSGAPGVTLTPHGVERGVNLLMFTLVDARAYPVFAVMFGYGLVQLSRRQQDAGASPAAIRSVLLRRNSWLVVFGLAHATLLYFGDFLGAYGIVGVVMTVLLLPRGDRFHRIVLWIWALAAVETLGLAGWVVLSLLRGQGGTATPVVERVDSFAAPDYAHALLDRLAEWPVHTLTVLPFIMIVWLGSWAARRGVLENPDRHRTLLRRTAVVGMTVAVLGGLPQGLLAAGLLHIDASTASLVSALYGASGMFAGPGYVALFGLLARRIVGPEAPRHRDVRLGPVVGALSALGRRSLSGYLLQSVAWLVLFAPYTFALGTRLADPTLVALLAATVVWLFTVVVADQLDRRSMPGPAELLLRRLTYPARRVVAPAKM